MGRQRFFTQASFTQASRILHISHRAIERAVSQIQWHRVSRDTKADLIPGQVLEEIACQFPLCRVSHVGESKALESARFYGVRNYCTSGRNDIFVAEFLGRYVVVGYDLYRGERPEKAAIKALVETIERTAG